MTGVIQQQHKKNAFGQTKLQYDVVLFSQSIQPYIEPSAVAVADGQAESTDTRDLLNIIFCFLARESTLDLLSCCHI